ncbi:hypothetical protein LJC05_03760 [Bacteroides sp. OttesenSCG-928-J23]|nr:hypothetical protein [Bacteroides sp. OttesenSCG-928-J23]
MKKIKVYTVFSEDGFVPREGLLWTIDQMKIRKNDYGFLDFLETVDCTILNKSYYNLIRKHNIRWKLMVPYYVVTNQVFLADNPHDVRFILDRPDRYNYWDIQVKELQFPGFGDIWLIGDYDLIRNFAKMDMLDEATFVTFPTKIEDGLKYSMSEFTMDQWKITEKKTYEDGVVRINYKKIVL